MTAVTPTPGPPTNPLAIVSLVTAILGISLAGIICGHIALGQIHRTGAGGHGLALAGVIVGYVGLAVFVIVAIVFVIVLATLGASAWTLNQIAPML